MTKITYTYINSTQTFTVPSGVLNIHAKLWGGGGGGSRGAFGGNSGAGGYVSGTIPVNSGDILTILVGEGGKNLSFTPTFGGGGAGGTDTFGGYIGGSGGGRSEIYVNGIDMLIAGGGGGDAGGSTATSRGGSGGGITGLSGIVSTACLLPGCGGGGTQSSGGSLGTGITPGTAGASYQGGDGGDSKGANAGGGGGGGGGFFGGGGGAGQSQAGGGCAGAINSQDCPGGGGSGFISSNVISGISLTVPTGTLTPPKTSDPDYITGTGVGVSGALFGGNGLVVISYTISPLIFTKRVNKIYSDVDSILDYTISLHNITGTTITNLILIDTTPTGSTFIDNSLQLNSLPIPGNLNPPGLTFPTIPPNEINTITFSVSIPKNVTQNPVINSAFLTYDGLTLPMTSNTVTTTISGISLSAIKSSTSVYSFPNDTITYTIAINSTGTTSATNAILIDTIPEDTSFINNSLTINGNTVTGATIVPPGYNLGTIPQNSAITLTYKVKVSNKPLSNTLVNIPSLKYNYSITPTQFTTVNMPINNVTIPIYYTDFSNIHKSVDTVFATLGSTLTYTIIIPNTGTIDALDVIFKDTIPSGTTFIPNSLTIDGIPLINGNLDSGIALGTIKSLETRTISFQVYINN